MKYFLKTALLFSFCTGIFLSPFFASLETHNRISGVELQQNTALATHGGAEITNSYQAQGACRNETDPEAERRCLESHGYGGGNSDCSWDDFNCYVGRAANFFLSLTGKAVQFTGNLLDHSIIFSLNLATQGGVEEGVRAGWSTFRDLANMVFIFALLYIAIATILQVSSFDTKKTLGTLIIVGLLLNFSLFFTKIVIDTSNVLGCYFYESVADVSCASGTDSSGLFDIEGNQGIAAKFADHTKITSLYNIPTGAQADDFFDGYNLGLIGFFGSIFLLILAFAFLMGAILFIIRSVALLFLMILSPLAFVGFALPYTTEKAKMWWNKLISYSFVAPVFLVLIFVVLEVMKRIGKTLVGGGGDSLAGFDRGFVDALTAGGLGATGVVFNFVLVIGLVIAAIVVSKSFGDGLGSMAVTGAQRITGKIGRSTIGRGASWLAESKPIKRLATTDNKFARYSGLRSLARIPRDTARRSFDPGNVPGASTVGFEKGAGTGGFVADQKKTKDLSKEQKDAEKEKKEAEATSRRQAFSDELGKHANNKDEDSIKDKLNKLSNVTDIAHVDGKTLATPEVARNLTPKMLQSIDDRANKGELELTTEQRKQIRDHAMQANDNGQNRSWFTTQRGSAFV